jgi:hypothetical protein
MAQHPSPKKQSKTEWGLIILEIGKWILVVWLLLPLGRPEGERFMVVRVVMGVCLFVIFGGKVFYDVIIMDIVRQRRTSVKQDIVTLIAAVVVIALLVGMVLVLISLFIMKWIQGTSNPVV